MDKVIKGELEGKNYTFIMRIDTYETAVDYLMVKTSLGVVELYNGDFVEHIATALPALPKHPTEEDWELLYRYMAEGLVPIILSQDFCEIIMEVFQYEATPKDLYDFKHCEITHCIDKEGNRVEVAIKDSTHKCEGCGE